MRLRLLASLFGFALLLQGCGGNTEEATSVAAEPAPPAPAALAAAAEPEFVWEADRFADIRVLRYQIAGFDQLSLQQKKLLKLVMHWPKQRTRQFYYCM